MSNKIDSWNSKNLKRKLTLISFQWLFGSDFQAMQSADNSEQIYDRSFWWTKFCCISIVFFPRAARYHWHKRCRNPIKKIQKKNVTNQFSRTGEMNKLVHCPYVNPLESKQVRQSQAQLELHLHLVTTQDWLWVVHCLHQTKGNCQTHSKCPHKIVGPQH